MSARIGLLFIAGCVTAAGTAFLVAGCGDDDNAVVSAKDSGTDTGSTNDAQPQPQLDAGGGPTDGGTTTKNVSIRFKAMVGAEPFACTGTFANLGSANTTVKPVDFRFYVHAVELVRADSTRVPVTLTQDGKWQYQDVALLDFEDKTGTCDGTTDTNDVVKGTVPAGAYAGIAFKIGVPEALNHGNQAVAPSPLGVTALFWSWQGGYKFIKIDSSPLDGDGGPLVRWNLHVGSTACTGDPADGGGTVTCAKPNRPQIAFAAFDADAQSIVVDYKAMVAGTDLTDNPPPVPGCMSQGAAVGNQCAAIFPHLGIDVATGAPLAGQTAFSVK